MPATDLELEGVQHKENSLKRLRLGHTLGKTELMLQTGYNNTVQAQKGASGNLCMEMESRLIKSGFCGERTKPLYQGSVCQCGIYSPMGRISTSYDENVADLSILGYP